MQKYSRLRSSLPKVKLPTCRSRIIGFDLKGVAISLTGGSSEPSQGSSQCPKMNMNEKKNKQVPIQLPSIARTSLVVSRALK